MKILWISLITSLLALFFLNVSSACTDFRITSQDGSILITRSMEFSVDMQANLRTMNRDATFSMQANGKPALHWKGKYGYLYLDGMNQDVVIDGMNEVGLSFEALYLPDYAMYQTIPSGQESKALPYIQMGAWILSNFKTTEEVEKALSDIIVIPQTLEGLGNIIFPLHFAVYDSRGKGIVIEFVNGKLTIYDNKIGLMTNSPTYNWHITNLANYVNLQPENPPAIIDQGMTFKATGQGFGMIGLPGDISPPSRFVKVAILLRTAIKTLDTMGSLNLAEHIINNVDIPLGLARELDKGNKATNDTTQWVVFKDLTHRHFYYRTYGDLSLRLVEFDKLDLSREAKRLKMPIADKPFIRNLTDPFLQSTL